MMMEAAVDIIYDEGVVDVEGPWIQTLWLSSYVALTCWPQQVCLLAFHPSENKSLEVLLYPMNYLTPTIHIFKRKAVSIYMHLKFLFLQ